LSQLKYDPQAKPIAKVVAQPLTQQGLSGDYPANPKACIRLFSPSHAPAWHKDGGKKIIDTTRLYSIAWAVSYLIGYNN
jgi:hypothetical protein